MPAHLAMLDRLRTPVFVVALVLVALATGVELGSRLLLPSARVDARALRSEADEQLRTSSLDPDERKAMVDEMVAKASRGEKPPGRAIPTLGLVDVLLLYTIALMGVSLVVPERVHGRVQGLLSLIVALVVLLLAIVAIVAAFVELMIMLALLAATPFGTLAYLAIYGVFDRAGATVALSAAMVLKLFASGALVAAHQRFLQNKGLVLLIVTTLVGTLLIRVVHAFVPIVLVSVTDAIAAIVVGLFAAIWAVLMLIGAVIAIVKAIV